jgi:hypothetical protein
MVRGRTGVKRERECVSLPRSRRERQFKSSQGSQSVVIGVSSRSFVLDLCPPVSAAPTEVALRGCGRRGEARLVRMAPTAVASFWYLQRLKQMRGIHEEPRQRPSDKLLQQSVDLQARPASAPVARGLVRTRSACRTFSIQDERSLFGPRWSPADSQGQQRAAFTKWNFTGVTAAELLSARAQTAHASNPPLSKRLAPDRPAARLVPGMPARPSAAVEAARKRQQHHHQRRWQEQQEQFQQQTRWQSYSHHSSHSPPPSHRQSPTPFSPIAPSTSISPRPISPPLLSPTPTPLGPRLCPTPTTFDGASPALRVADARERAAVMALSELVDDDDAAPCTDGACETGAARVEPQGWSSRDDHGKRPWLTSCTRCHCTRSTLPTALVAPSLLTDGATLCVLACRRGRRDEAQRAT